MGKAEATLERVTRYDLRHDNHTVSLLTDHLVFSPKYRGKVLDGAVSEALALDPLCQKVQGAPRVNYIMEPAIMGAVMNVIEQDRIEQKTKGDKK